MMLAGMTFVIMPFASEIDPNPETIAVKVVDCASWLSA